MPTPPSPSPLAPALSISVYIMLTSGYPPASDWHCPPSLPSTRTPPPRPRSIYVTGYKTTAKLIKPDAVAGASIVHVIDRVLIPDLSG